MVAVVVETSHRHLYTDEVERVDLLVNSVLIDLLDELVMEE
jgi:hypothetical protein